VYRDSPKEGTKGGKNERKALNLHNPRTCTDYTGITKKGDGRESSEARNAGGGRNGRGQQMQGDKELERYYHPFCLSLQ
jgi:hypothetical protein